MSGTSKRCDVCNELTYTNSVYCSSQCQDEANRVYDDIANAQEPLSDEEWESIMENEPPYLDDYYSPYKKEWLD